MSVRNASLRPAHLPQRLTISFPIWGLLDTDGKGDYADFDKMMLEHRERGFNCIRLDGGAGLMHDLEGRPLPPVELRPSWGEYNINIRQSHPFHPGFCDVKQRLIDLFTAAKKHEVYIILSSWYFLHTYWQVESQELRDAIFAIDPHERHMAFAKFLHYILLELESRDLIGALAFAEIFNEADGLPFTGGYGNAKGFSQQERAEFAKEHSEAIAFLKEKHPDVLFAYDISNPNADPVLAPKGPDVFNFHSYFMWSAYTAFEKEMEKWWKENPISREDVIASSNEPDRLPEDWIDRVRFYTNLDPEKIPQAEKELTARFLENIPVHRDKRERNLGLIQNYIDTLYPDTLLVCGEGVSYIGNDKLLFEEKCPQYWELMRQTARRYREFGLWGTVVRTCCGPEDPVWYQWADELKKVNEAFLKGE